VTVNTRVLSGLWDHQRDAIDVAREYLAAPDVHGESALITMPTGTGKTGVIASITTCLPEVTGHRLVLTPWDALVKQMIDDLRRRFWDRLGVMPDPATMPAIPMAPADWPSSSLNSGVWSSMRATTSRRRNGRRQYDPCDAAPYC
jgi:hypothetical protein